MKTLLITSALALVGLGVFSHAAPLGVCQRAADEAKQAILADPAKVLILVSDKVSASPACSCEIVKAAISATNPSPQLAAAIFEAAARSAPERLDTLLACAIAAAPDAAAEIQAAAIKIDPSVAARMPSWVASAGGNPLNSPGQNPDGTGMTSGINDPNVVVPVMVNPPTTSPVDLFED